MIFSFTVQQGLMVDRSFYQPLGPHIGTFVTGTLFGIIFVEVKVCNNLKLQNWQIEKKIEGMKPLSRRLSIYSLHFIAYAGILLFISLSFGCFGFEMLSIFSCCSLYKSSTNSKIFHDHLNGTRIFILIFLGF